MSKYSEAQNKSTQRYIKKAYDQAVLRFRKDSDLTLSDVQQIAEASGESMQAFIMQAIRERIDHLKTE